MTLPLGSVMLNLRDQKRWCRNVEAMYTLGAGDYLYRWKYGTPRETCPWFKRGFCRVSRCNLCNPYSIFSTRGL